MPRGNVRVSITADATGVTRATHQAERDLNRLGATGEKSSKRFKSAMKGLAGTAGVGSLIAGASVATKTFIDFDKSMRNVNSIAQLSEGRLKSLSKQVLGLAGKTAQAPTTLADGLYQLVSSGFDANESMKILASSARAATAGLTTTEVSTKAVAAVLNAYRMPAGKAADVSDVLFRTVDRGVITFEDLAQNIGDTLPFAASLGVSLREVGAATATMTKQGLSAPETMTRIRNVFVSMLKPGDQLKQAYKELGVSSGEALIRQRGFQGALQALVGTTDGSKRAVAALFPNIRSLGGAMALTGKNTKAAQKDLKGFEDASGATSRALAQQSKSVAFQWQELKAQISARVIEIGNAVLPIISGIVKAITTMHDASRTIFRAMGRFLVEVWTAPKKAFGNLFAAILRGMAKLMDLAGHLPGVGGRFKKFAGEARNAANQLDRMGEESRKSGRGHDAAGAAAQRYSNRVRDLREQIARTHGKKITVGVTIDLASPEIGKQPFGDGWGVEDHVTATVRKGVKTGKIDPFGLGPVGPLGMGHAGAVDAFTPYASKFGLTMTSGFRKGSITSSGNLSLHALNRARDYGGAAGPMLAFARFMASRFGGRLAELIHSPMGFSIKNGRRVAPYAVADHYDHVHVGLQRGGLIPGFGSGDKIPVMAEPGEGFLNKRAVQAMGGRRVLDALNRMVPRFQKGGVLGPVAAVARKAGFKGGLLQTMVAIAMAESSGNPRAHGPPDGRGLWQIEWPIWGSTLGHLGNPYNPQANAKMAMQVYRRQGLGAWVVYNTGAYRQYMAQAAAAVKGKGGGKPRKPITERGRRTLELLPGGSQDLGGWGRHGGLAGGRGVRTLGVEKGQPFPTGGAGSEEADDSALIAALEVLAELERQRIAVTQEHTAQMKRNEYLITQQGPQMVAAVMNLFSQGMGRTAALGRRTPAAAGRVAAL